MSAAAFDLAPALTIAALGAALALGPLGWVWVRHRGGGRLAALAALTLFLTLDLVLFGAFTRLTDSGLGCPDWPGCYGQSNPVAARGEISAAQQAMPTGPVTHGKAWVEMLHRYLATAVGALITVLLVATAWQARRGRVPRAALGWAVASFVGVCVQGAFGAFTVTLKLYPAIVTLHLLGGLALLALLVVQHQALLPTAPVPTPIELPPGVRRTARFAVVLVVLQIALGGWVSTNYAVLACSEFPTCHDGQWWPAMDFEHGFTLLRELGLRGDGAVLSFQSLTAIHMVHRLAALVVLAAIVVLAWWLRGCESSRLRRFGLGFGVAALWQFASGLSNVVLGWPIVAALAHTGGAAVLVLLFASLLGADGHRAAS